MSLKRSHLRDTGLSSSSSSFCVGGGGDDDDGVGDGDD